MTHNQVFELTIFIRNLCNKNYAELDANSRVKQKPNTTKIVDFYIVEVSGNKLLLNIPNSDVLMTQVTSAIGEYNLIICYGQDDSAKGLPHDALVLNFL